jgi:hypothetical protein
MDVEPNRYASILTRSSPQVDLHAQVIAQMQAALRSIKKTDL